jgi:hypothetical protein
MRVVFYSRDPIASPTTPGIPVGDKGDLSSIFDQAKAAAETNFAGWCTAFEVLNDHGDILRRWVKENA